MKNKLKKLLEMLPWQVTAIIFLSWSIKMTIKWNKYKLKLNINIKKKNYNALYSCQFESAFISLKEYEIIFIFRVFWTMKEQLLYKM